MQMAEEASLLDDVRFVEELAKLEALPDEDTSAFPKPAQTIAEQSPPVVAIADELPPALGPRTKGPQFVLAPPPSRHKSSYRRPARPNLRIRMSLRDEQPADATDSVSPSVKASAITDDPSAASGTADEGQKNPETETSLNAFPSESAAPSGGQTPRRVRAGGRHLHPALAVVGFVLMMSIGAGAAALVFHDRVTQIVALWETARR